MKLSSKKPIVLFDIDYTLFDTALFKQSGLSMHKIYAEVTQTLDGLNNFATLGIFSKGETQFQKTKLEKTGMEILRHARDMAVLGLSEVLRKYFFFKSFTSYSRPINFI